VLGEPPGLVFWFALLFVVSVASREKFNPTTITAIHQRPRSMLLWLCPACHGKAHGYRRPVGSGGRSAIYPIRILIAYAEDWMARLDNWRARQPGLPNRSEAVRYLVEVGIKASAPKPPAKKRKG
jgi:hypothetical protein